MQTGERIRAARQGQKMTMTDLARASSLTKGFISQVEGGNLIRRSQICSIASALETR